jgi:dolichol kinase
LRCQTPSAREKTLIGLLSFFAVAACALAIALGIYVAENEDKKQVRSS